MRSETDLIPSNRRAHPQITPIPQITTADSGIRVSQAADLNHDRHMDLVPIDERRGAFIFFGEKGGTFSNAVALTTTTGVTPYALTVGDLNGDRAIDVVVGNVEAPSVVYLNDGTGRNFTPVAFVDNKGTVYGFAIGDLDGDGLPDIAAARSDAPNVVYFAVSDQEKDVKNGRCYEHLTPSGVKPIASVLQFGLAGLALVVLE